MATIKIKNLKLRTVIGIYGWERKIKQTVLINAALEFDASKASKSDNIKDTVDYKLITKRIIQKVEQSKYFLIEKLADQILKICLEDKKVKEATVEVDKPKALRFAESVSITIHKKRT